jgi:hypothetical protein
LAFGVRVGLKNVAPVERARMIWLLKVGPSIHGTGPIFTEDATAIPRVSLCFPRPRAKRWRSGCLVAACEVRRVLRSAHRLAAVVRY